MLSVRVELFMGLILSFVSVSTSQTLNGFSGQVSRRKDLPASLLQERDLRLRHGFRFSYHATFQWSLDRPLYDTQRGERFHRMRRVMDILRPIARRKIDARDQ